MVGLPNLSLTAAEQIRSKKERDELLKKREKAATPNLRRAIALAIEDGAEAKADDIVERLDHIEDGVATPQDKFKDLLITQDQLGAATIPLQIPVRCYRPCGKLYRADVAACKSVSEVITLVLGTASGRL